MNKQCVFAFLACLTLFAAPAMAGSITLSNGSQTGMAEWDLDGGDLVIKLYNLTAAPYDAVDLLTGFRFCLLGADDAGPIEEATADAVWISDDGEITATASDVDLLKKIAPRDFRWTCEVVEGGGHVPENSYRDGIAFIFGD